MFGGLHFLPITIYGCKNEIFQDRVQMLLELPLPCSGGAARRVLVSTQTGERDRPGRRWQRPVANLFSLSVRRDADRRAQDARAPHFTRELEKLHPDISKAEG
jgi:hypothetical protein